MANIQHAHNKKMATLIIKRAEKIRNNEPHGYEDKQIELENQSTPWQLGPKHLNSSVIYLSSTYARPLKG